VDDNPCSRSAVHRARSAARRVHDPPFRSQSLDGDPGIAGLQRLNPPLQRRADIVIGQDVQLRPKPFCGTLPHRESAAGPAVEGVMRIVPLLGLPVPAHLEPDVYTAHPIIDPTVAEILQPIATDPRRQVLRPAALAGEFAKLHQAHRVLRSMPVPVMIPSLPKRPRSSIEIHTSTIRSSVTLWVRRRLLGTYSIDIMK
jgi:hypothetical protein